MGYSKYAPDIQTAAYSEGKKIMLTSLLTSAMSDEWIALEINTVGMNHTYRQPGSDVAADRAGMPGMISGSPGASDDHKSAHERHLPNRYSPITAMTTATTDIQSLI
jgi:hypothetical protein